MADLSVDRSPAVLVLASTYPRWAGDHEPGFVHELARRLVGRFRVIAIVPRAPGASRTEVLDGVEVIRYRYAPAGLETLVNDGGIVGNLRRSRWKLILVPGFILAQWWCAWRILRREKIDVIHAHWLIPQGLSALVLSKFSHRPIPYMVTSHGVDLFALKGPGPRMLKRMVLNRAAAVSVVSQAMVEELRSLGAATENVAVQPMGVDLQERFTPGVQKSRSADEILFVGRLVEKKGLRHLIEAMPSVLLAHPSAFLTVVGFGPEESACRAQVRRLGLESSVRFLGAMSQTDIPALYRRAAVFAAPFVEAVSGDREGLGLVLVEAAGCGCPVVVSDLPAVRDVMQAGAGCVRVMPGDSGLLAAAIVDVMSHPEIHQRGVEASLEQLVNRFDWASVSQRYGNLLEGCVEHTK